MSFRDENIAALIKFFATGCKPDKLLGLELEHFVVGRVTKKALPYEGGVEEMLRAATGYGAPLYDNGRIIGLAHASAPVSLEPAAQLEVSIGPYRDLADIKRDYQVFRAYFDPLIADKNCELVCAGYQPASRVDALTMIPKSRYRYMDEYFRTTGKYGRNMMRGTAATQVCIDYADEADFAKKFRVANVFSPLFAFITDNTNSFEGQPFHGRMLRTQIWNDVDPDRSMIVNKALDMPFGFHDYAQYLYDLPAVIAIDDADVRYVGRTPVSEIYANRKLTDADIDLITSMAFPDVRVKQHIEIRVADSMPIERALAYAALIYDIFYTETTLEALYQQTLNVCNREVAEAKLALIAHGADAMIYGRRASAWMDEFFIS